MRAIATIYKCSNCSSSIRGIDYWSGNTIGSVFYSDTYNKAPMKIPEGAGYIGCTNCKKVFTKASLEVIKQYKDGISSNEKDQKEYESAPNPLPYLEMLKVLLEDSRFNGEKNQKAFTLWYLWFFNHDLRPEEKKKEIKNGDYKKYTDRLIEILDLEKDNQNSQILKIEILREREKFNEAGKLLEQVNVSTLTPIQKGIAEGIKIRLGRKDSVVFKLKRADTP